MWSMTMADDEGRSISSLFSAGLRKGAMATPTWRDCFDYSIRYGSLGGHLPFMPQTRFNKFLSRFQIIVQAVLGVRMFMTIVFLERGYFIGLMFVIYVVNILITLGHINMSAKKFRDYFDEIDDFLLRNENNPITGKKNHFMEIWRKEKPHKLEFILLISSFLIVLVWYGSVLHSTASAPEGSRSVYWSPFIETSVYMKWYWGLQEIFPAFCTAYLSWYVNMVFTSFVTFQYAQLLYVKELAIAAAEDEKNTNENMLWWLKVHQQVIGMAHQVTKLLQINALSSYFAQLLFAGLSIILLLFENVTQTEGQKILCLIFSASHLSEFGRNCIIVDRWDSVQSCLREIVFTNKLLEGDKWRMSAYKIFLARADKPLLFSAYRFVILNSPTFREMMINIFSIYTSFRSVLTSKAD